MRTVRSCVIAGLLMSTVGLAGCGKHREAPAVSKGAAKQQGSVARMPLGEPSGETRIRQERKREEKTPPAVGEAQKPQVRGELELFVPCAFAPPVVKIVEAFKKEYPQVRIVRQVENVEVLAPRIEKKGAKPDVFLCIGDIEMDRLQKRGLVQDRKDFCFVGLALVVHEGNPKHIKSLADLTKPEVRTVGIGAEETSPGYYARQLLAEMKIWDKVRPKVVCPKFPSQLLKFAGSLAKVDASIAYGACLRAGHGEWKEQDAYQQLSRSLEVAQWLDQGQFCQTIPCPAATVTGCSNREAGEAFIDFLRGDTAQEYLKKSGFTRLDEPKCFK